MGRRFLTFHAGAARYALELDDVAEVMEPKATFPLPVAPRYFTGLINFHGTLTAVLDLALFLGRGRGSGQGKFLVLHTKVASLALWVDGVGAIVREEGALGWEPSEEPLLEAVIETAEGTVRLFRAEALLSALEEGVAAAAPGENHNREESGG